MTRSMPFISLSTIEPADREKGVFLVEPKLPSARVAIAGPEIRSNRVGDNADPVRICPCKSQDLRARVAAHAQDGVGMF